MTKIGQTCPRIRLPSSNRRSQTILIRRKLKLKFGTKFDKIQEAQQTNGHVRPPVPQIEIIFSFEKIKSPIETLQACNPESCKLECQAYNSQGYKLVNSSLHCEDSTLSHLGSKTLVYKLAMHILHYKLESQIEVNLTSI